MTERHPPNDPPEPVAAAEWDAGELGCGEVIIELKLRVGRIDPGQYFRLCARDLGAPEDIPAWCRLTGHRLACANHPEYLIQRKN